VTAELLLARFTISPPLAAASFSVTVHASVPVPVRDELAQESAVSAAVLVLELPPPIVIVTMFEGMLSLPDASTLSTM
jgi:hypothetical protein